jgi:hypothetical protein
MEIDEATIEGDVVPFPGEDVIMMIFGRQPSVEKSRGLNPRTRIPSRSGQ